MGTVLGPLGITEEAATTADAVEYNEDFVANAPQTDEGWGSAPLGTLTEANVRADSFEFTDAYSVAPLEADQAWSVSPASTDGLVMEGVEVGIWMTGQEFVPEDGSEGNILTMDIGGFDSMMF